MNTDKIHHINYISEITNLDRCDFIASVLTSWQFDVAVAYIQSHHLNKGILIVEAVPFSDVVKYRLSEDQVLMYENLFEDIYFCKSRKQPYQIGNLIKCLFSCQEKDQLLWLRPLHNISLRLLSNIIKPHREIHYVALDEGLTSYMPFMDTLKMMYTNTAVVYAKWFIQKAFNALSRLFIKGHEDFGLFYREYSKLAPNKEVCTALRQVYMDRVHVEENSKRSILFFKDYLVIPEEQAIYIFEKILEGLKGREEDIIIKKHPSDTKSSFDEAILSKYPNVRIINAMISGEELVATYQPNVIVGGFSTVVMSSSFIYDIPTISFAGIYLQKGLATPIYEKQIKFFMNQLGDYIPFGQSTSEVCQKINEYLPLNS